MPKKAQKSKSSEKKVIVETKVSKAGNTKSSSSKKGGPRGSGGVALISRKSLPLPSLSLQSASNNTGEDWVRVKGREVFLRVANASGFTNQGNFRVNPLDPALFPKLSAISTLFEKWKLSGNLKVSYSGFAPATRTGNMSMYLETDPADSVEPSTLIALLNERFSSAGPVWEDNGFSFPVKDQAVDWYYTSQGSSDEKRLTDLGTLRVYSGDSSTGDAAALNGFCYLDYDITFATFRPADLDGFVLDNKTEQKLVTSGNAQVLLLCDSEEHIYGVTGNRYLFNGDHWQYSTGTASTNTQKSVIQPPNNKNTLISVNCSLSGATDLLEMGSTASSHNAVVVDKKRLSAIPMRVERKTHPYPVGVTEDGAFEPWALRQLSNGSWTYQMYAGDSWHPLDFNVADFSTPLTAGDVIMTLVYVDSAGTTTTLYTGSTVNNAAAFAYAFLVTVLAVVPGGKYIVNCIGAFTTARSIVELLIGLGPSYSDDEA